MRSELCIAGSFTVISLKLAVWLSPTSSGLDPVDENKPKEQLLADLQEALRAVVAGNHYPVSELWDNLDD
jgi:hypothetical protein